MALDSVGGSGRKGGSHIVRVDVLVQPISWRRRAADDDTAADNTTADTGGLTLVTISLPPGAVLANRYQILRSLGRGGMGALYLAHDLRFARRLVVLNKDKGCLFTGAADEKRISG